MGLTIDPSRGLIYWVNWAGNIGTTISYAHLDGSGGGDLDDHRARRSTARTGSRSTRRPDPTGPSTGPTTLMAGTSSIWRYADADGTGNGGVGGDLDASTATLDEPRGMMIDPVTTASTGRTSPTATARRSRRPASTAPTTATCCRSGRPARVPRAPRSIPPPGRSTGPTTAIGLCCSTPTSTSVPGSRPSTRRGRRPMASTELRSTPTRGGSTGPTRLQRDLLCEPRR